MIDANWIDVGYTWEYPNSFWKENMLKILKSNNIYQIGRYGKWKFQGILESIQDALDFVK